jgi:hypothetical protein
MLVALCACSAYAGPRAPAHEDDVATAAEVATWTSFEDSVCHAAGATELDDTHLRVSLPRAAFFEPTAAALRPGGAAIAKEVATMAKGAARAAIVEVLLEDDAAYLPDATRLANERANTLRALFDVPVHVTIDTAQWMGSFDGPALLSPEDGRIDLGLATADGRKLRRH